MSATSARLVMKRGDASKWSLRNPVLLAGEIGFETDTNRFKFGDGTSTWTNLKYASFNLEVKNTAPTTVTGYEPGLFWINNTNGFIYFLAIKNSQKSWERVYTATEIDNLLDTKVDVAPVGNQPLFDVNGKINFEYIPDSIINGLTYGGVIGAGGIISASNTATALDGLTISEVDAEDYPGYFFIFSIDYTFSNVEYNSGDWIISQGNHTPAWAKIDNSDKVSSVNGKTGAVSLYTDDISEKAINPVNLYYTETRFTASFEAKNSTELADGDTVLHSTDDLIFDGGLIE